jgi:DNA-directed RNA polymerase specialized sigma subunit
MLFLVEYNMYLQLGVAGLRALENYNPEANVSFVIFSIRC